MIYYTILKFLRNATFFYYAFVVIFIDKSYHFIMPIKIFRKFLSEHTGISFKSCRIKPALEMLAFYKFNGTYDVSGLIPSHVSGFVIGGIE